MGALMSNPEISVIVPSYNAIVFLFLGRIKKEKGMDKLLPGITGWAQVNGRDELSIPDKVALDVEYMHRQSFWFDMKILWMTFLNVIKRVGVLH
jgi:O-antigen biosynthesis protein WbqP